MAKRKADTKSDLSDKKATKANLSCVNVSNSSRKQNHNLPAIKHQGLEARIHTSLKLKKQIIEVNSNRRGPFHWIGTRGFTNKVLSMTNRFRFASTIRALLLLIEMNLSMIFIATLTFLPAGAAFSLLSQQQTQQSLSRSNPALANGRGHDRRQACFLSEQSTRWGRGMSLGRMNEGEEQHYSVKAKDEKNREAFNVETVPSPVSAKQTLTEKRLSVTSGGGGRRRFLQSSAGALTGCFLSSCYYHHDWRAIAASDETATSSTGAPSQQTMRKLGGLPSKFKKVGRIMDELQRDLMQERWDLVEDYPAQLRSYVPIFTTYTDSAFASDAPTDNGLRVALRYEVGRFFASVQRLKQSCSRRNLDEAYMAYADMSLHFDRYLRVGGLYSYYDDNISTEPYFKGISDSDLVFSNPVKDPPLVRDLVVLIKGPEKGKTGILIGQYPDGSQKMVVKLDRYKGMREIRVVQNSWVAKRLGEQDPDDVFLIPRTASTSTVPTQTKK